MAASLFDKVWNKNQNLARAKRSFLQGNYRRSRQHKNMEGADIQPNNNIAEGTTASAIVPSGKQHPNSPVNLSPNQEEEIVAAYFERTGLKHSLKRMIEIAYQQIINVAAFKCPLYGDNIKAFVDKSVHDEKHASHHYRNLTPDSKWYWEVRCREERQQVEKCRKFLSKLDDIKNISLLGSAPFFNNLELAAVILIKEFFYMPARKLNKRFAYSFLLEAQEIVSNFTVITEDMAFLIDNRPKDFIRVCLEKGTLCDYEMIKKFHDARVKIPNPQPVDYSKFNMVREAVERLINSELIDMTKPILGNQTNAADSSCSDEDDCDGNDSTMAVDGN